MLPFCTNILYYKISLTLLFGNKSLISEISSLDSPAQPAGGSPLTALEIASRRIKSKMYNQEKTRFEAEAKNHLSFLLILQKQALR